MATRPRLVLPLQPKPAPTQRPRGAKRAVRSTKNPAFIRTRYTPSKSPYAVCAPCRRYCWPTRRRCTEAAHSRRGDRRCAGKRRCHGHEEQQSRAGIARILRHNGAETAGSRTLVVPPFVPSHPARYCITLPHAFVLRTVAAVSSQKVTNGILMDLKGSCASEVDPHPAPTSSVKPGTTLLKSSSTTMRDLRPRTAGQRRMTNEACTSWPLGLVSAQPPRKRSGPVHVDMANQEPSITRSSKARFCAPVRMAWECCKCRLGVGSTSRGHVGEQRQVQHVNALWARKVGVDNANGARKVVATASAIQPLKVSLPVRSRQFRSGQRARGPHPAAELWSVERARNFGAPSWRLKVPSYLRELGSTNTGRRPVLGVFIK